MPFRCNSGGFRSRLHIAEPALHIVVVGEGTALGAFLLLSGEVLFFPLAGLAFLGQVPFLIDIGVFRLGGFVYGFGPQLAIFCGIAREGMLHAVGPATRSRSAPVPRRRR